MKGGDPRCERRGGNLYLRDWDCAKAQLAYETRVREGDASFFRYPLVGTRVCASVDGVQGRTR